MMKFNYLANKILKEQKSPYMSQQGRTFQVEDIVTYEGDKAIVINLEYNNEEFSEVIPSSEIAEATEGLEPIRAKNGLTIYRGETYVVVVMGN